MAANLPGSGTQEDPYRIMSYDDFAKMDGLETGAYYKLVNNINMIGRKWSGVNLNGGYLDLSDKKIEYVDIEDGSFCFYAGTIYAQREEWFDGTKIKENKAGYILNITGNSPSFIFKDIDFVRIGWTAINVSSKNCPFDNITGLESYFWFSNNSYTDTFIKLKGTNTGIDRLPLIDCVVSINGTIIDQYIIHNNVRSDSFTEDTQATFVDRCLITGKVKTKGKNTTSSTTKTNSLFLYGTCRSSIIDIEHDPDTYVGGDWIKAITYIAMDKNENAISPDSSTGVSIVIASPSNDYIPLDANKPGIAYSRTNGFTVNILKNNMKRCSYLKSINFFVEPEPET